MYLKNSFAPLRQIWGCLKCNVMKQSKQTKIKLFKVAVMVSLFCNLSNWALFLVYSILKGY